MGTSAGKPVLTFDCVKTLSERTGMEYEEIENYFKYFLSVNPDGKMDRSEFSKILGMAEPGRDIQRLEDHVFRVFDTDGSGNLDFPEFCVVYHSLSEGAPKQVLRNMFRVFDINNDGEICQAEMARLVRDMYVLIQAEEEDLSEETVINSTFSEMDRDFDDRITEEEFVSACLRQSRFTALVTGQLVKMF